MKKRYFAVAKFNLFIDDSGELEYRARAQLSYEYKKHKVEKSAPLGTVLALEPHQPFSCLLALLKRARFGRSGDYPQEAALRCFAL